MTLRGGGDYFRSNFNYRNIWDNLVRELREAKVFVKGRFPGILIILHVLASLVLLLRHAASQSAQCLFLSRWFRIPDKNRVNQVGL